MSGTTRKIAGLPAAIFITEPAVTREKASEIIGQSLPDEAWQRIRAAVALYHERLQDLTSSRDNRKKDDPQGWAARQPAAVRHLEKALDSLQAACDGNGAFLHEASENFSLQTFGCSAGPDRSARRAIDRAFKDTLHALTIVERARSREMEVPTAATARDMAIREIHAALVEHGIKARASTGRELDRLARSPTPADLTAFERLLGALQIDDERKAEGFSKSVRSALAGRKRG